jgi:hypothetical protein
MFGWGNRGQVALNPILTGDNSLVHPRRCLPDTVCEEASIDSVNSKTYHANAYVSCSAASVGLLNQTDFFFSNGSNTD